MLRTRVLTYILPGEMPSCPLSIMHGQLASALVEHETLDAEEVQKVIRGESIRNIDEVIKEDLSRLTKDVAAS